MLKIMKRVCRVQEFDMGLEEFKEYIKDARLFDNTMARYEYLKEPEITLYCHVPPHFIRGFAEVPVGIFMSAPEDPYEWDVYVQEHIEIVYDYLVSQGIRLELPLRRI